MQPPRQDADPKTDRIQSLADHADTIVSRARDIGGTDLIHAIVLTGMREMMLDAPTPYAGLLSAFAAAFNVGSAMNDLPEESDTEH